MLFFSFRVGQPSQVGYYRVQGLGYYWGYIGIMEKKMETTIQGVTLGFIKDYNGVISGNWKTKWKLL